MTLQSAIEVVLVLGAVLLLARDMRRVWLDRLRRPITVLMAAAVAAVLIGAARGPLPNPWWLILPASVLAWEAGRGWRRAPRCHLREAGVGALAAALTVTAAGLGLADGSTAAALFATAAAATVVGAGLLWRSRGREPRPGRIDDAGHYERRLAQRAGA